MSQLANDPNQLVRRPVNRPAVPSVGAGGRYAIRPVELPDSIRRKHIICYGETGAGKTTLLERLIWTDLVRRLTGKSQRGVAVVDVIGDLSRNFLARAALLRRQLTVEHRRLLDQILYIVEPKRPGWTVAYDPFEVRPGESPESRADHLSAAVSVMYHDDPTLTVRQKRVIKHAALALIIRGKGLRDIPKFLTDSAYREEVVTSTRHPNLKQYWFGEFPTLERQILERVESTANRLDLLFDEDIEEMLTGPSTIDFRKAMDDGAFIICRIPRHKLGEGAAYLLGAFIVEELKQAASGRLDVSYSSRRPFTIVLDEYQHLTTDSILQGVEGSRKVALELILATQEVKGRPTEEHIRRAIRKIAGSILTFRVSYEDARTLAPDIFNPDLEQVKHVSIRYQKVPSWFGEYAQRFEDPVFRGMDEIWEREIRRITNLPDRTFWFRTKGDPHAYVVETPPVKSIEDLADPDDLALASNEQNEAAFRLAGRRKFKKLPTPTTSSHSNIWGP